MLLSNTFLKNYTDKYKNNSNTIEFSTASLLLQKQSPWGIKASSYSRRQDRESERTTAFQRRLLQSSNL